MRNLGIALCLLLVAGSAFAAATAYKKFKGQIIATTDQVPMDLDDKSLIAELKKVGKTTIEKNSGGTWTFNFMAFLTKKPGVDTINVVVYPTSVQAAGGIRVVVMLKDYRLDLDGMARAITPLTKLVFIANPNNPTATIVTADEVEHFMARVPERTIVIFDEAYIEFAQGLDFPDSLAYAKQGRKVVVLRTFSKAASLAGLRVGYGIGDPDAIALLNRIRPPFNVNSLAQAAALAALEDESHVLECVRLIDAGRHFLYDEFKTLGIKYVPSRANFILVDVGRSAADIYQNLLREGVIVRPLTSFGMETALRITIGTPQENRKLVKGLRAVLGKKPA